MVRRTTERAAEAGIINLRCELRDVMEDGFGLPDASQDVAWLFNIFHWEQPGALESEATRVVRPCGSVLVIHWWHDPATPRGPSLNIRPRSEQIDLPPWHYGMRLMGQLSVC